MQRSYLKAPRKVFLRHPSSIPLYSVFQTIRPYTEVNYDSQLQMKDAIEHVDRKGIKGSIVETGCWNGGCGAFMAWVSKRNGSDRKTWLFDAFETVDAIPGKDDSVPTAWDDFPCTAENAREIVSKLGVSDTTTVVKGFFSDTLPVTDTGPIAVLRRDGNWYQSTMDALENLYDRVVQGGYVVIDDYDKFDGCRMAIYDFFSKRKIAPRLRQDSFEQKYYLIKP